jgi:hypothetical protein
MQDEGEIHALLWRKNFIICGNDKGVRIYDMESKNSIIGIPR